VRRSTTAERERMLRVAASEEVCRLELRPPVRRGKPVHDDLTEARQRAQRHMLQEALRRGQ
jgi:hypothetical protein